ncbi:hypothetical protein DV714_20135 [Parageobacillus thermoglucosidasius]|nr:hypothetical protein DV714_20135 [Parageobacillus thermoglucosidasius]
MSVRLSIYLSIVVYICSVYLSDCLSVYLSGYSRLTCRFFRQVAVACRVTCRFFRRVIFTCRFFRQVFRQAGFMKRNNSINRCSCSSLLKIDPAFLL